MGDRTFDLLFKDITLMPRWQMIHTVSIPVGDLKIEENQSRYLSIVKYIFLYTISLQKLILDNKFDK